MTRRALLTPLGVRSAWGAAALAALLCLLAACGSASTPRHAPLKVTLSGQLTRRRAGVLSVHRPGAAPLRVHFSPMRTPIYAVRPGARVDIQPGSCISVAGTQDPDGVLTATSAIVSTSVDDDCPAEDVAPPTLLPLPSATPPPSPSDPSPPAAPSPPPQVVTAHGQVLADGGAAVTILGSDGHFGVVLVSAATAVQDFTAAYPSALLVPSCVMVTGWASGRRNVAATKLIDVPLGTGSPCS